MAGRDNLLTRQCKTTNIYLGKSITVGPGDDSDEFLQEGFKFKLFHNFRCKKFHDFYWKKYFRIYMND
jgi:hypothetical protein